MAIHGDGRAVVSFDLTCCDEAVAEAMEVQIDVALVQHHGDLVATSGGSVVTTCIDGTQRVTLVQASFSKHSYRPGSVYALVEFHAFSSKGGVQAIGDFDLLPLPVQVPAR